MRRLRSRSVPPIRTVGVFLVLMVGAGCGLLIDDHPIDGDDPRFEACGGSGGEVVAAFPMRAADYKSHFPQMGLSPELDADEPAFAVVFEEGGRPPLGGLGGEDEPGTHFVCVYLGSPPNGTPNWYGGVDITGMNP
jgi:hypothetical protein